MYPELSTERVLTMEWINGVKPRRGSANFDDANAAAAAAAAEAAAATSTARVRGSARLPPAPPAASAPPPQKGRRLGPEAEADLALVEVGVRCSLEQMLSEGFYHADPHAGNILRMPDGRCGAAGVRVR